MTPKHKDLAKRFVKCERWKWMPGMLARYSDGEAWHRLTDGDGHGYPFRHCPPNPREAWPDLTDPATLGCILALVREATGDRRIHCRVRANVYRVYSGVSPVGRWMESEAEALLLALEVA
jgi:hypothetical protein